MTVPDLSYVFRIVLLVIFPIFASSAATTTPEDFKVVSGVAIYLGVVPSELIKGHPGEHTEREMHGGVPTGQHRHHVVVALFDNASGKRIENAKVQASVAEIGLSGPEKALEPMTIAGATTYGNYFTMSGQGPYIIRLQIQRPEMPGIIKAIFKLRHFHS